MLQPSPATCRTDRTTGLGAGRGGNQVETRWKREGRYPESRFATAGGGAPGPIQPCPGQVGWVEVVHRPAVRCASCAGGPRAAPTTFGESERSSTCRISGGTTALCQAAKHPEGLTVLRAAGSLPRGRVGSGASCLRLRRTGHGTEHGTAGPRGSPRPSGFGLALDLSPDN